MCALFFQILSKLLGKHSQVNSYLILLFLKVVFTSANFSSSGNSLLFIDSLNNFVKVSEQLCALDFKTFGGMVLHVAAFLIRRSSEESWF